MSKISLLKKLQLLLDVSTSSYWLLLGMGIFLGIGVFLFTSTHKNKKQNKMIYLVFSFVLCAFLVILYHKSLNKVFEYLMDNLFVMLLFPNYVFYFLEILGTNIILWVSLFNNKTNEAIKKLNIIVYLFMNYLLMLVLSVIDTNKLDIFTVSSLYSNEKATALMELSSALFIIWIIFLILYKIILTYVKKDYKEPIKKLVIKKETKYPMNYKPTKTPNYIYGNAIKQKEQLEQPKEIIKEKEIVIEDIFTLEEYKMLHKVLAEQKEKQKQESKQEPVVENKEVKETINIAQPVIDIEKMAIEEIKRQEEEREEEKFTELERLYRSIK